MVSNEGNVNAQPVIDVDELDLISSSTLASPASKARRVSSDMVRNEVKNPQRKRTLSKSALENVAVSKKKPNVQQKKAITIVLNVRRAAIENSRRRWLSRHWEIFSPLLPSSSTFFETLKKELNSSVNIGAYAPLHQFDEQPQSIKGGMMKEYQLQGLSFLAYMYANGMNCILGDEMGLGKTLQTLSLFAHVAETSKSALDPHLIICPLSVLSSWISEASRWLPSFRTLRFHGAESERQHLKKTFMRDENQSEPRYELCITTYEAYVAEDTWFKSRRWTYCVLDEGHRIKNSNTILSQKIQGIGSLFRLILTGTPVQNNLVELWSILHWLYPTVFTRASEQMFKSSFSLSTGTYELGFLNAAKKLLSTIMIRRAKAVVEASVPPREELTLFIPLTEAQRFWYYRLLTRMDTLDLEEIFGATGGDNNQGREEVKEELKRKMDSPDSHQYRKLLNLLVQLRRLCDHPYLLEHAQPEPYVNGEHVVASSSKLIVIDKLLEDILPQGEKVLIFSQWTGMLDVLEDFMVLRGIPYARLDGSTNRVRRTFDIKLFQQENSPYKVFLISTKAGGLGINLTKASTVIMCDCDWNPQNDLQAVARAHRIGQTKTVKVYRLICKGSVEDMMLDRIRRKLFLSVKVMGSDNPNADEKSDLGTKELLDILRRGSSALSSEGMDLGHFLKANIREILEQSKSTDNVRDAKAKKDILGVAHEVVDDCLLDDAEKEEQRLLSGVAQVQCRLFEGNWVERHKQDNVQIANEWKALQKRAHVDRTVVVDGITMISDYIAPEAGTVLAVETPKANKKPKFESEDWCIYCRDGGKLFLCSFCPRVFHAECHGEDISSRPITPCPQHACADCKRKCGEAGGVLFKCRTCHRALCEDCLPFDTIEPIGYVLPELLVLGYGERSNAFYIKCHHCIEQFAMDPQFKAEWESEFEEAETKLATLRSQEMS